MTPDKLYGILKQYGVNSPQYRNAYNTFTGGKGTIVKTKEDGTIIAPTLDEITVTPSAKDKGDLIASKVSKAMNKSGNIAMAIGGTTLAAPFIIGSTSTALPIIKSTILDTGKFLISNPEVSREMVKDILVGSGIDLGYETITKKPAQLGEALNIENPVLRFVTNTISPGSFAGSVMNIKSPKFSSTKPIKSKIPSKLDWETWSKSSKIDDDIIDEYIKIENKFKGTDEWLKLPDGTYYEGDPRAWVQMKSKNFTSTFKNPEIIYHGSPNGNIVEFKTSNTQGYKSAKGRSTGDGGFYTSPSKTYADRYQADNLMTGHISEGAKTYTLVGDLSKMYDAKGKTFISVDGKTILPSKLNKNDIELLQSKGYNGIKNFSPMNNKMEHVFFNPSDVKSLEGNNGKFNLSDPNIYKFKSHNKDLKKYTLENADDFKKVYDYLSSKEVQQKISNIDKELGTNYKKVVNAYLDAADKHPNKEVFINNTSAETREMFKTMKDEAISGTYSDALLDPLNTFNYWMTVKSKRSPGTIGHEVKHLLEAMETASRLTKQDRLDIIKRKVPFDNFLDSSPRLKKLTENNIKDFNSWRADVIKNGGEDLTLSDYNYFKRGTEFNSQLHPIIVERIEQGKPGTFRYKDIEELDLDINNATKKELDDSLQYLKELIKDKKKFITVLNKYGFTYIPVEVGLNSIINNNER